MPSVADLRAVVSADTRAAERALDGFNSKLGGIGAAGKVAAAGIAVLGGGMVAGIGAAVKSAADFERTMSGVRAVSGATGEEMQQLSGLALQLGKDTSFTASEAAAGLEELVKGGVKIPDIMSGAAQATLNLAAAGGVDLPAAAQIASNALNTFSLKGTDMARVSDLIAGAANASAIDVNDFRLSLAASGAVAATIGMSFDDTAVAIAALGNAGVRGSDAGTSLKTMLLNLQPVTEKQIGLFKDLGLVTADGSNRFFDAEGKLKSFADVSQVLQDALSGQTDQQKLANLEILFGSDAIRAAAVFTKLGAGGFNELAGSMGKVTAEAVAATRLDNLAGDIEQLGGSAEAAAIKLGQNFQGAARGAVQGLTQFINQGVIPFVDQYGPGLAQAAADAGQGLMNFGGTVKDALGGGLQWVQDRLAELGPALAGFSASTGPFGEVLAGVFSGVGGAAQALQFVLQGDLPAAFATAQGAGANFGQALEGIRGTIEMLVPVLAGAAASFAAFQVLTTIAGAVGAVAGAWGTLSGAIAASGSIIGGIVAVLGGPVTLVIAGVVAVVGLLVAAWVGNWGDIQGKTAAVVAFLSTLPATIGGFFSQVGETASGLVQAVGGAFSELGTQAQRLATEVPAAVGGAFDALGTWVRGALDATGAAIGGAFSGFGSTIQGALSAIQANVTAVWNMIPEDIRADLALIASTLAERFGAFLASTAAWLGETWTAITSKWSEITSAIGSALGAIGTDIAARWAEFTSTIGTALGAIGSAVSTTWSEITSAIGTQLSAIGSAIGTAWEGVTSATGSAWDTVQSTIGAKIGEALGHVTGFVGDVLAKLGGLVGSAATQAASIGQAIVDGIRGGIQAAAQALGDAAAATVRQALAAAKAALGIQSPSAVFASQVGVPIVQGILRGLDDVTPTLDRALARLVSLPPLLPAQMPSLPAVVGVGALSTSHFSQPAPGPRGGAPGLTIVVNVQGSVTSERDLVEAIRQGLLRDGERNGRRGVLA